MKDVSDRKAQRGGGKKKNLRSPGRRRGYGAASEKEKWFPQDQEESTLEGEDVSTGAGERGHGKGKGSSKSAPAEPE